MMTNMTQQEAIVHNNHLKSEVGMKNILIIDDSRVMRKMIKSALMSFENFNFIEAGDGVEGLDKVKKYPIALVIVDYNMPRMNGIQFMKELKSQEAYKKIPMIMLTTESEERKMIDGYVSGAKVYMTKPFKPEELQKVVETIRYWHMG